MGFTEMAPGSVWNTMPPHTHARRMEVYLYFDVPKDGRVFHLMGQPNETRHIVVADSQAIPLSELVDPLRRGDLRLYLLLGHGR